nr:EOG090X0KAD [Sida crystallina]
MAATTSAAAADKFVKIGKVIRLTRFGCTNRPFYRIVVQRTRDTQDGPVIEQVGSYDPLPNIKNEKLVAFNFERVQHWLAQGASLSGPVAELLGLSGYLPVHPRTTIAAWRNRMAPPRESKLTDVVKGVAAPPTNPKL